MVALDIIKLLSRKQRWVVVDLRGSIIASATDSIDTVIHESALQRIEKDTVLHVQVIDQPTHDGVKDDCISDPVVVIKIIA